VCWCPEILRKNWYKVEELFNWESFVSISFSPHFNSLYSQLPNSDMKKEASYGNWKWGRFSFFIPFEKILTILLTKMSSSYQSILIKCRWHLAGDLRVRGSNVKALDSVVFSVGYYLLCTESLLFLSVGGTLALQPFLPCLFCTPCKKDWRRNCNVYLRSAMK